MRESFEAMMNSQNEMRIQQKKIDDLFNDHLVQTETDKQAETISEELRLQLEKSDLTNVVKEAIIRQKNLLDKAIEDNQLKEKHLKEKMNSMDQEEG